MESKEASAQLSDLSRLGAATRVEATKTPRVFGVVMTIGVVLLFVAYGLVPDGAKFGLSMVWTAFVLGWLFVMRQQRRVRRGLRVPSRRGVIEWVVWFVIANVLTLGLSRISWALTGAVLGLGGALVGSWYSMRRHHS
jgi:hypothetical protein